MILTGYLSWTAMSHESVKGCSVGSACEVVLSSPWSTLLGMPTAFWGFLAYTTLAAIAFVQRSGPSMAVRMGGFVLWHSLQRLSHNGLVNGSPCGVPVLPDIAGIDDRNLRFGHVATSKRPDRFLLG